MNIKGVFKNPNIAINGNLSISDDGSSSLKIDGEFTRKDILLEEYIFCDNEDNIITLKDIGYHKKSRSKSVLNPNIIFIANKKYNYNLDKIYIKKFNFSLHNIDDFCCCHYELYDKNIEFEYMDYKIKILFYWDFKVGKRKNTIEIASINKHNLREYQDVVYKFVTFVSFAIGNIANQYQSYFIDSKDCKVEIYYKPSFYQENGKSKKSVFFKMSNKNIHIFFTQWIELLTISEPIIPLYFMPYFYKIDFNVKYLLLSQTLEAFHRKITRDDNKHFIDRIKDIVFDEMYKNLFLELSDEEALNDLCKKIRTTRNYLTHYNVNNSDEILDGHEKLFSNLKLELLIDLYLLKFLGFVEDDFKEINHSIIKDKFDRENVINDVLANKTVETNS